MQNLLRIIVAAIIVLSIIAFMTTYTVRFTEKAVVTTFGKANDESVRSTPGLGFKWPYPIQSVTKYDTRARYIEARSTTIGTADDRQVIVTAYLTWQVDNPLEFYSLYGNAGSRSIDHFRAAEETLRRILGTSLAEISRFKLSDLLSAEPGTSKLSEAENKMLGFIASQTGQQNSKAVKPLTVGIAAIRLPDATSRAVFDTMQQRRNRLSSEAINRGKSLAEKIKVEAENDAKKIMSFAERRAGVIRAQGDREATEYLAKQNTDPDLAVFLKNLEFMRNATSKRTTLVLSLNEPGLGLFRPGAVAGLAPGKLPRFEPKPAAVKGAGAEPAPANEPAADAGTVKPADAKENG